MQKITAVKPKIFTYLIHQHTPLRVKIEKKIRENGLDYPAPHMPQPWIRPCAASL